jgi:hypothetical protein
MLRLKFAAIHPAHSLVLGPAERFHIAGNFIRQEPGNTVLAEYVRHQWRVRDQFFSRYDCTEPCCIYFTDAWGNQSEHFGPFQELLVADGTMYANDQLFAKFIDETLLWHSFRLETWWPSLILAAPHPT